MKKDIFTEALMIKPPTNKKEEWGKRFDLLPLDLNLEEKKIEGIKSFIRTLLATQRQEFLEWIEKIIEKEAGFYLDASKPDGGEEITAIELSLLRKGLREKLK